MTQRALRVFSGPSEITPQPVVPRKLSDLLAVTAPTPQQLAWLRDFADDPILITEDLADILDASARLRQQRSA